MTRPPSPPSSTYRLQLNRGLTFDDARENAAYLHELGIDACYVSPILESRPGSMHGYDVIDHSKLNPEIGSMESLERFVTRLRDLRMGLIVDVVPNHMCVVDPGNTLWHDVLENGPSSPQARFFDIDWNPPREGLADKVLLPTLGDQFGRVLEKGEIRIEFHAECGGFAARYWETAFPLAPRTWPHILAPALELARRKLGPSDLCILELESILTALSYLPMRSETDVNRLRERQREKEIAKRRIAALAGRCPEIRHAIDEALRRINGRPGYPSSFDALERLLGDQAYRLSFWRVAADEINYRRFFDINELAAIRTEDPVVFEETHRLLFDLIHKGWITGLRIDHPDGLFDPAQYFEALQDACGGEGGPFYVVAEKILAGDEQPRSWRIEGTTGYGYLNLLNGLFVYPGSRRAFRALYDRWTGPRESFPELIYESKRLILRASMSSELNVLARRLDRICQRRRGSRDFTLEALRFALSEIIACFPVYRTYSTADQEQPDAEDRRHIERAVADAKERNPATSESVFDFIASLLLLEEPEHLTVAERAERRMFVMRFQQLTGPVMAKGVEDTAFYRYYPLASLNEVGGDPERFAVGPPEFHRENQIRLERQPRAMLATSTHDTKRGEDVRARIDALSEIPLEWYAAVRRWNRLNAGLTTEIGGQTIPDRNAEYLLYQTLVGAWPMAPMGHDGHAEFTARIQQYMEKALREAKLHTSWISPDPDYEESVRKFVAGVLCGGTADAFLRDFGAFVAPVIRAGMGNSLAQSLLKIASPGIPDFFQGCETWNLSLVDPDNRRPVDFARLREQLCGLRRAGAGALADALRTPEDGRVKLWLTSLALAHRREHRDLYLEGAYLPVEPAGARKMHVVAFARARGGRSVVAAAARFFLKLNAPTGDFAVPPKVWGETALHLPRGAQAARYRDVLSGREVRPVTRGGKPSLLAADVFASGLPAALLEARE